jgi:hypothetical protein
LEDQEMKKLVFVSSLIALALIIAACGSKTTDAGKVIKTAPVGDNLTVALATSDGVFKHGNSEFTLTFSDAAGKPVEIGAVALTFHMPQMGTMAEMNNTATFTTTETPGVYRGKANIEVAGEWQVKVTYDGSKGHGQVTFPVTAQ